ncbi:MAG: iron-sulfur cluster assembly scaffold protein [Candidatus Nasuia deltocephalinicola]
MSYSNRVIFFCKKDFFKFSIFSFTANNLAYDYVGSYSCGDIIFFQVIFFFFNIFNFTFRYKTYGCGSAISSTNISFFYLINKFYFNFSFLKNFHISEKLKLPSIKFHCSVLVEQILVLIISNYKNNYLFFFF